MLKDFNDNYDEAGEREFDREERRIARERCDEEAIENRLAALRQQEFLIAAVAPYFTVHPKKGGR